MIFTKNYQDSEKLFKKSHLKIKLRLNHLNCSKKRIFDQFNNHYPIII